MLHFNEEKSSRRTSDLLKREAVRVAQFLSAKHGIPYIDLTLTSVNTEALGLVPEEVAKNAKIAAYRLTGKRVDVAAFSPLTPAVDDALNQLKEDGWEPRLNITTMHSLERAWKFYSEVQLLERTKAGQIDIGDKDLGKFVEKMGSLSETKALINESLGQEGSVRISSILEVILSGAIAINASDVHIEPEEKEVRVRYRLDGILHEIISFDAHTYKLLSSRIKLLSGLKLNIGSKRQDGRYSIKIGEGNVDIRTSIIPGAYGESIVMRLLNPKSISMSVESLGIEPRLLGIIRHAISQPNGMLLTTGPTGSGKTTSLYAFLGEINQPGVKIITIEDPIEYHMDGVVQTQVDHKKGYTFLEGLKSAMRQDPDIIMVGEIRDNETAGTAIDAALTGHLVFSTLHTNNAAGTIPRLLDLMVNPKVIGPALTVSLAQRLVRKVCQECKTERDPTEDELRILNQVVEDLQAYDLEDVPTGVPPKITAANEGGCNACDGIGYKGRVGIYEGILVDQAVEEVIPTNPSEHELWAAAAPQKIPNMMQDGIIKMLRKTTTMEELARVVNFDRTLEQPTAASVKKDKERVEEVGSIIGTDINSDLPPLPPLESENQIHNEFPADVTTDIPLVDEPLPVTDYSVPPTMPLEPLEPTAAPHDDGMSIHPTGDL